MVDKEKLLAKLRYARALLTIHGVITDAEKLKIDKRITKWWEQESKLLARR